MKKVLEWKKAHFAYGGCDVCGKTTTRRLFERDSNFRGDDETIASACEEHFDEVRRNTLSTK